MSTVSPRCAAAQAHRRLVATAAKLVRLGQLSVSENYPATAQKHFDLARDLLALTSLLHAVLHSQVDPADWPDWLARVRELATDRLIDHFGTPDLPVLLESLLIVRWGDAGAMLVSPLPTRQARARFASEGQVQP